MFKYIIEFLKAFRSLQKFKEYTFRKTSKLLYLLNFLIIKYKFKNYEIEKNFKIFKIDLSDDEISRIYNDLKIKKYNFEKYSNKLQIVEYPLDYLKEISLAWGFDRQYYVDFFEKKLNSKIKELSVNVNYRIEHIWLYETSPYTENINEKFHIDSDSYGGRKCLIYITDVDLESGPFTVHDEEVNENKKILGKKGTSILFNQRKLYHSNSKNGSKNRIVLSFTIYPTLRKKIIYQKNKPLNSLYSINPFTKIS